MSTLIAIVDDKAINRNTFEHKIKLFEDLDIVFMAVNGNDCLEQLKGLPVNKLPKLIFMDLEMPGLSGIQTIEIAKQLYPQINFIVLTVFDDEEKIFESIKAGACGYLLKDENAGSIYSAIINTLEFGGSPMSPAIARKTLDLLSKASLPSPSATKENDTLNYLLSDREKEILQYTIHGDDAKRIAQTLNISVYTVRKHISNIYEKLHVNSKAQIMHLAHQQKWFDNISLFL